MSATAKIRVRKPARADGTTQVRMQVIIDREPLLIPLKIYWPAALVDEDAGKCLTKLPKSAQPAGYAEAINAARKVFGDEWEKKSEDFNLLLGRALSKANEIFIEARLSERALSTDTFLSEYHATGSKLDFLVYMDVRIEERWKSGDIKRTTWKNHRSTFNKLREFKKQIPFNSLTHRFADDFEGWLKKHGHGAINTRWQRHKETKTYLELARRDRIAFEDPYKYFKVPLGESSWKAMQPDELERLESFYQICAPGTPQRRVLQKFLFSCNSSLRLSDLKAISSARLEDRQLRIKTHKGAEKTGKELLLPLTRKALRYLHDSQRENDTEGFYDYSDQYENRLLKHVAALLGITTNLHHHVGRETFATNFIRLGGSLPVLQKLMGHTKISMTMKYVHVDEAMKQAEIDRMDSLDDKQ